MDDDPDGWECSFLPPQHELFDIPSHLVAVKIIDVIGNEDVFVYAVPNGEGPGVLVRREFYPKNVHPKEIMKRLRKMKKRGDDTTPPLLV